MNIVVVIGLWALSYNADVILQYQQSLLAVDLIYWCMY